MATSERNGDGSPANPSGVYRHPDTGEELVTQATAKFGNPQADAIVRLGFVYVGPADERKVTPAVDPGAPAPANTTPSLQSVGQLEQDLKLAKEREAGAERAAKANSELVKEEKKGAK